MRNKKTELVGFRRIDDLGRVMLVKEVRNKVGIKIGELLRIEVNDKEIIIRKMDENVGKEELTNALKNFEETLEKIKVDSTSIITPKDKIMYNIEVIKSLLNQMEI